MNRRDAVFTYLRSHGVSNSNARDVALLTPDFRRAEIYLQGRRYRYSHANALRIIRNTTNQNWRTVGNFSNSFPPRFKTFVAASYILYRLEGMNHRQAMNRIRQFMDIVMMEMMMS
jgi:hypothetical protein